MKAFANREKFSIYKAAECVTSNISVGNEEWTGIIVFAPTAIPSRSQAVKRKSAKLENLFNTKGNVDLNEMILHFDHFSASQVARNYVPETFNSAITEKRARQFPR